MRVLKQFEDSYAIMIIETGEKRKSYYKFVTYRGNTLRQDETIDRFTYSNRNAFSNVNSLSDVDFRGCKLWFKTDMGTGVMCGCIRRIDKAELCLELMI